MIRANLALGLGIWLCMPWGCTIEAADDDDQDATGAKSGDTGGRSADAGAPTETPRGGSANEEGGMAGISARDEGGAAGQGGSAGQTGSDACGTVTERGVCDGEELVYCTGEELRRVDCALVGLPCQVTDGRADCASASALARAETCDGVPEEGECEENVLSFCDTEREDLVGEQVVHVNCEAYGQVCDPTGAVGDNPICVPHGACPEGLSYEGECDGNSLRFCESSAEYGDELYVFDCGVDECRTVDGFADCFMVGVADGCQEETAAGRCEGTEVVQCLGNVVAREDCAALGLECQTEGGESRCGVGDCPAECPADHTCASGRCEPDETPSREWTVAAYVVGDNNLADAVWSDLNEMEMVGSTDDVQIVAEFELSDWWGSVPPTEYLTGAYRVPIGGPDDDATELVSMDESTELGDDVNMGSPEELASFLRWAAETYPAQHYALVMLDHGMGWKGGFVDDGSSGELSLRHILDGVRDSGVHLDLLGFDACLMAMHEVGLSLRGVADVLVASEEIEPGAGWPHDEIWSELSADPSLTAAEVGGVVTEAYSTYYDHELRANNVTMSVLDLSQMEAANEQLASFSEMVRVDLPTHRFAIRDVVGNANMLRMTDKDSVDLDSALELFEAVEGNIGDAATDYRTWFGESGLVLHNGAIRGMDAAEGLSFYLPDSVLSNYKTGTFEDYRSSTDFIAMEPWHSVLANLLDEVDEEAPGEGATDNFALELSWADEPDGTASDADLDLYVYEPDGTFAVPAKGTVTSNATLSADSHDSGIPRESYQLKDEHDTGYYVALIHYWGPEDASEAFVRLQVFRDDLPGGSRTLLRGKVEDRELVEYAMSKDEPLPNQRITKGNIQEVLDLEYTDIWYAMTIEVE